MLRLDGTFKARESFRSFISQRFELLLLDIFPSRCGLTRWDHDELWTHQFFGFVVHHLCHWFVDFRLTAGRCVQHWLCSVTIEDASIYGFMGTQASDILFGCLMGKYVSRWQFRFVSAHHFKITGVIVRLASSNLLVVLVVGVSAAKTALRLSVELLLGVPIRVHWHLGKNIAVLWTHMDFLITKHFRAWIHRGCSKK